MPDSQPVVPHALLLGAGASIEAGVPATEGFVTEFPKSRRLNQSRRMKRVLLTLYAKIVRALKKWAALPENNQRVVDIEAVLEAIADLSAGRSTISSAFGKRSEEFAKLRKETLQELLFELKDYIRDRGYVEPRKTEYLRPYQRLISEAMPLPVFSVNYDLVMEAYFDSHAIPYTDGFELNWSPNLFEASGPYVHLFKLHGSVNWFSSSSGRAWKLPLQGTTRTVRMQSGENAEALMAYPAQKAIYAHPLYDLFSRFQEWMRRGYWLIVVGYSFRDEQIIRAISDAALVNQNLNLILIGPSANEIYRDRLSFVPRTETDELFRSKTVESPLKGRVLVLPFEHGAILPQMVSTILPAAKEAWRLEAAARVADFSGQAAAWRDVALAYLRASFLEKAVEIETSRFSVDLQEEIWKLPYLTLKGVVALSLGEIETGIICNSRARAMLQEWMVSRLRVDVSHTPAQVRPLFGYISQPSGGFLAYNPDTLLALVNPAVMAAERALQYVPLSKQRTRLESTYNSLKTISSYLETYKNVGSVDLDTFVSTRRRVIGKRVSQLGDELLSLRKNYQADVAERVRRAFEGAERQYIRNALFRGKKRPRASTP